MYKIDSTLKDNFTCFPQHLDEYLAHEKMTIKELIARMNASLKEDYDVFIIYSTVFSIEFTTMTIETIHM